MKFKPSFTHVGRRIYCYLMPVIMGLMMTGAGAEESEAELLAAEIAKIEKLQKEFEGKHKKQQIEKVLYNLLIHSFANDLLLEIDKNDDFYPKLRSIVDTLKKEGSSELSIEELQALMEVALNREAGIVEKEHVVIEAVGQVQVGQHFSVIVFCRFPGYRVVVTSLYQVSQQGIATHHIDR